MEILCAIGERRGVELIQRVAETLPNDSSLILLYVINTGPRRDLETVGGPLRHVPVREHNVDAAEETAGRNALEEALAAARAAGFAAETRLERGNPERVIVEIAQQVNASLVTLHARENFHGHPRQGPPSVGHTARFVLDHAPAYVLLFRERT